jgi:hypothetical protein
MGAEAVLDLGLRLGEGTGALLAWPMMRAAADMLREMATLAEVTGGEARRPRRPSRAEEAPDQSGARRRGGGAGGARRERRASGGGGLTSAPRLPTSGFPPATVEAAR